MIVWEVILTKIIIIRMKTTSIHHHLSRTTKKIRYNCRLKNNLRGTRILHYKISRSWLGSFKSKLKKVTKQKPLIR